VGRKFGLNRPYLDDKSLALCLPLDKDLLLVVLMLVSLENNLA